MMGAQNKVRYDEWCSVVLARYTSRADATRFEGAEIAVGLWKLSVSQDKIGSDNLPLVFHHRHPYSFLWLIFTFDLQHLAYRLQCGLEDRVRKRPPITSTRRSPVNPRKSECALLTLTEMIRKALNLSSLLQRRRDGSPRQESWLPSWIYRSTSYSRFAPFTCLGCFVVQMCFRYLVTWILWIYFAWLARRNNLDGYWCIVLQYPCGRRLGRTC
jgi:hypothetical protein